MLTGCAGAVKNSRNGSTQLTRVRHQPRTRPPAVCIAVSGATDVDLQIPTWFGVFYRRSWVEIGCCTFYILCRKSCPSASLTITRLGQRVMVHDISLHPVSPPVTYRTLIAPVGDRTGQGTRSTHNTAGASQLPNRLSSSATQYCLSDHDTNDCRSELCGSVAEPHSNRRGTTAG
jgi:hypothetical protein